MATSTQESSQRAGENRQMTSTVKNLRETNGHSGSNGHLLPKAHHVETLDITDHLIELRLTPAESLYSAGLHMKPITRGTVPHALGNVEIQVRRCLERLRAKPTDLDKYEFLATLRHNNTHLFYRLLIDNVIEMTPLVYTPTIGTACLRFSDIYAHQHSGLYLTIKDKGHVQEIINSFPLAKVQICVVTDGSRILGLGDLGVNGMGIPIGKLSLYVACAGIHPSKVLPVMLDLGTNNQTLLNDPLYMGLRQKRIDDTEALTFAEEFHSAFQTRWPRAICQFEDFHSELAFSLLEGHRYRYPCFNDDIQGTGAVSLAGFINAIRLSGIPPAEHRFCFFGAGSAAVGIAQVMCAHLVKLGIPESQARQMFWLVDSKGLVAHNRGDKLPDHKLFFARSDPKTPRLSNLAQVVDYVKPTGLLGLSTVGGAFSEPVLRTMADNNRPIIFPLSNPVSKSECTFEQALKATQGRCLFASGSPFQPMEYGGQWRTPGQGNNVYIFPPLGLGAILAKVSIIPDELIHATAEGLAASLNADENKRELLYPELNRIREVTVPITRNVIRVAQQLGIDNNPALKTMSDSELDTFIIDQMYEPLKSRYAKTLNFACDLAL